MDELILERNIHTLVEELLYMEDQDTLINKVAEITDERVLHLLGCNYNWDDGFAVPEAIIKNPNCHLSTALALFYLADGIRYLKEKRMSRGAAGLHGEILLLVFMER